MAIYGTRTVLHPARDSRDCDPAERMLPQNVHNAFRAKGLPVLWLLLSLKKEEGG
jgi:hypothetical protein